MGWIITDQHYNMDSTTKPSDPLDQSQDNSENDPLSRLQQAQSERYNGGFARMFKQTMLGKPRNIKDPNVFHAISLIAFLAWVGLGADGLSSRQRQGRYVYRVL